MEGGHEGLTLHKAYDYAPTWRHERYGRSGVMAQLPSWAVSEEARLDKKIAGMVGALAAVTPVAAMAAPADPMAAASYADLLKPIPNAVETLKASDATLRAEDGAKVEMAQYYHHHHHHHFFHRRFYHHHHHFFHRRFFHHHHHHFY